MKKGLLMLAMLVLAGGIGIAVKINSDGWKETPNQTLNKQARQEQSITNQELNIKKRQDY
ncbi:hypothetical protein [Enterococcus wangshanyuanii]|uniref:Uncharacterized protein n=1 Tax=Enterococcus wangshanyuanii TaxID=2005703 RepID=A0ABQ1P2F8_9ENTE|nr:hypothetical protein [Enterococcus wangshanyuanii]GGC89463.1 hypothetical protein GCM10011573_18890 [Enterococcus wangshanyuanii]